MMSTQRHGRLLDWRDVAKRIPLSRTTIWHLRRTGAFPEPTRISDRRIAWPEDEINAWIDARHANDVRGAVCEGEGGEE